MDEQNAVGNPLVSVILPVYNGERYLAEALESVLMQSYRPIEIIVIDDGSTDRTAQIVARFQDPVRYTFQPNAGPATTRNRAVRMAKGEFITFIDADDLWTDEKLAMQMDCFKAFPEIGIVQGLVQRIKHPDHLEELADVTEIDHPFISSNLGAMVIRRSVFEKNGTFDEDLLFHEDTDFWFRAREKEIPILVQRKVALVYRMHGENLTHGENIKTMGFPNILFRSIRRRRKASEHVKPIPRLLNVTEYKEKQRAGAHLQKSANTPWPRISVILHVSPDQTKVDCALESLSLQDYHPIELLIVGARPDKAMELAADRFDDITSIQVESPDLATQLNVALQKCTGEFISFLDTKDESVPGAIKAAVKHFLANPQDGIVVGRTRLIIEPERKYPLELIDGVTMYKQVGALLGAIMLRRCILDKVGGFSTGFSGMEGFEWLLRVGDMGILHKALHTVFVYRFIQAENNEMATKQMQLAAIESVRRSIHRKRSSV